MAGVLDLVYGNRFFRAWQIREELAALGEVLAARRPACAFEIGTASGGTLLFLTRLARADATIVSVDLRGGNFGGGYGRLRRWAYRHCGLSGQNIRILEGDSHSRETRERIAAALGGRPLDYLFIDGDHSYAGVSRDFELYAPLVARAGWIAFHDIVDGPTESVGGVPRFWREIKSRYRHSEFIHDPKQGGYGLGLLYVD